MHTDGDLENWPIRWQCKTFRKAQPKLAIKWHRLQQSSSRQLFLAAGQEIDFWHIKIQSKAAALVDFHSKSYS